MRERDRLKLIQAEAELEMCKQEALHAVPLSDKEATLRGKTSFRLAAYKILQAERKIEMIKTRFDVPSKRDGIRQRELSRREDNLTKSQERINEFLEKISRLRMQVTLSNVEDSKEKLKFLNSEMAKETRRRATLQRSLNYYVEKTNAKSPKYKPDLTLLPENAEFIDKVVEDKQYNVGTDFSFVLSPNYDYHNQLKSTKIENDVSWLFAKAPASDASPEPEGEEIKQDVEIEPNDWSL